MATFSELAEEALRNTDGEQDIEKKIEEALACPCIGDLKEGPCGPNFVKAFGCFIRSDHEDKGMDCIPQFKDFQECLKENPDHLAKIMKNDEDNNDNINADKSIEEEKIDR